MTRRPRSLRRPALCALLLAAACTGSDSTTRTSDAAPSTTPLVAATTSTAVATPPVTTVPPVTTAAGPDATDAPTIQLNGPAAVDAPAAASVVPEGFTTATVRITEADGSLCDVCMWLADDGAERAQGLMGVTDLGDAAGMAFAFDTLGGGAFYMYRTVTPLSIAWFGADGEFVSSTDMEPCLDDAPADCPRYGSGGEYQLAIEVFSGNLAALGIGPGSTAEVLANSEAPACPQRD